MSLQTYNVVGTIERNEIRETNGRKYRLFQIKPLACKKLMSFFVSPEYRNGDSNKVYTQLESEKFRAGRQVKVTFSALNSSLFLFNVKEAE